MYVLLLVCAFILSGCGNSADESPKKKLFYSYESYELVCPVKSVNVRRYEVTTKFGDLVKEELADGYYTVIEFNHSGHIEKYVAYDDKDKIMHMQRTAYDHNGFLSEVASYSEDGQLEELHKYVFREDGNWLKRDTYNQDGDLKTVSVRKFEGDKLVEYREEKYNDADTLVDKTICKFNGNVLEYYSVYQNGELYYTEKYSKYDEYGIQESSMYDASGDLYKKYYLEKDKNGELVVGRVFDADGNKTYDKEIKRNENDLVSYERVWEDEEETITEYEYEYDHKGNWIKKIQYEGTVRKPVKITEREIVYW